MSCPPCPTASPKPCCTQIAVSCDVSITEARKYESKAECEIWTLTAIRGKQIWKTVHEDRCKAACALAEMVGFEVGG
jgi:hypothetical protein